MKNLFLFILILVATNAHSISKVAYYIKYENGNLIGYLIKICDMENEKNKKIIDLIKIDEEYFCIIDNFSEEYRFKKDKNLLKIMKSKFAKGKGYAFGFSLVKNTGIEHRYEIISKIGSNYYKFNIYGDITYIYLKSEEGDVFVDEKAFEYIISKNEKFKKFLSLISLLEKGRFSNLEYIFYVKNGIKKLGLEKEHFIIEKAELPYAEEELLIGFKEVY